MFVNTLAIAGTKVDLKCPVVVVNITITTTTAR